MSKSNGNGKRKARTSASSGGEEGASPPGDNLLFEALAKDCGLQKRQKFEDWRQMKLVPVHGCGLLAILRRGDGDIVTNIFRDVDEEGTERFSAMRLKKAPATGWESESKLVWRYNRSCEITELKEMLEDCKELRHWRIEVMEKQPMDFIATDAQIVRTMRAMRHRNRDADIPEDEFLFSNGRTLAEAEREWERLNKPGGGLMGQKSGGGSSKKW